MLIDADGDKIHDKKGKMIDMDIFPFPLLAFKKFLSMSNFANKNTEHPCSIWELPMLKKKKNHSAFTPHSNLTGCPIILPSNPVHCTNSH